jgi:L-seryl-tRNA(Ser) seleniumtransferase
VHINNIRESKEMNIYEHFGAETIINAFGTNTRYGGALVDPGTIEAIAEANRYSIRLDQLHAVASKIIAERTHTEAGLVTCGAAAGITLATAACICGLNVSRMNRLPDTTGIPNEVIIPSHQIGGFAHAIRLAGARLISAGMFRGLGRPMAIRVHKSRDIEAEISENTVMIAYYYRAGSHPPLEEVIAIGKKYKIPVFVDAAAQVPPVENLHKLIDMGADLVAFSGGKGIRGPQDSGILCGPRNLIASAALQSLDMGGDDYDEWDPPQSFMPKEELCDRPHDGIGRGMKVTKEVIIGLLAALEELTEEKWQKRRSYLQGLLQTMQKRLENISGLEFNLTDDYPGAYPMLEVKIDEHTVGKSAYQVCEMLKKCKPAIYARKLLVKNGIVIVHSLNLNDEIAEHVGERIAAAITT